MRVRRGWRAPAIWASATAMAKKPFSPTTWAGPCWARACCGWAGLVLTGARPWRPMGVLHWPWWSPIWQRRGAPGLGSGRVVAAPPCIAAGAVLGPGCGAGGRHAGGWLCGHGGGPGDWGGGRPGLLSGRPGFKRWLGADDALDVLACRAGRHGGRHPDRAAGQQHHCWRARQCAGASRGGGGRGSL